MSIFLEKAQTIDQMSTGSFSALSASDCPVAFCLTNLKSQCGFQCKMVEIVIERCSRVLNYREYYFAVTTTDLMMIHTQKRFWL